ncbi:tRNA (adenosine(37)-N6)-threonylcarbamoyltransferase complex transferase subunit TsaD [Desulfuromonas sp. AOP6]|uniref:tRNA (adenosine(37)-N6)-threonylcarbamoyltransferase complex transferase subunit TsaD n=1 Tax=Desulfuromonas sp. AOP6 TaxID=1566351 RepID=UPI00126F4217|nr:tRNA (adenosine(37)-N6)-threonylcarbamoyltransferase complex transferase subunit TsaD [Desulfuromonas sp. AOP6]BCA79674.1 tRNA N6-adenosine threonylcarbamoyltransferase [Desulfuromonas sp. AOP6]
MLVLAIESSCDETSAAVVRHGREVLSNVIASQVDIHARYGGVVPELASRKHVEAISVVIDEALEKAQVALEDIEGIAVTRGPGLVGALLVGLSVAKALAFGRGIPMVGVHHIEGHILSPLLEQDVDFPFLALAVSGGHTHLYRVDGIGSYTILGRTLDDAAGEAFDKVAKLLGLGYPGGQIVDRLAAEGNPEAIVFPRPLLHQKNLDFSFSGIKTAVLNYVRNLKEEVDEVTLRNIAAGFQAAVVEVLTRKTLRAATENGLSRIVVAGGVACNRGLRESFKKEGVEKGFDVFFPSPGLCGDNAAMLAVAGDAYLESGCRGSLDLNAVASWPLDQAGQLSGD